MRLPTGLGDDLLDGDAGSPSLRQGEDACGDAVPQLLLGWGRGLPAQGRRAPLPHRKANGANGARPKPRRSQLGKGSKLFREWHGETHEVLVLDKGFAWRGETYQSLSAIARAITGAHWNGWAFFGLKRPTKEAPANG
jgi:hypothetical protein